MYRREQLKPFVRDVRAFSNYICQKYVLQIFSCRWTTAQQSGQHGQQRKVDCFREITAKHIVNYVFGSSRVSTSAWEAIKCDAN